MLLSDLENPVQISEMYRKRWGIEVFFLHCKTNGFNLEDLNFKGLKKIQILMALAAAAYVFSWAFTARVKPIKLKNYRDKKSESISLFRLGFDNLKNTVHHLLGLLDFMLEILSNSPHKKKVLLFSHKSVQ